VTETARKAKRMSGGGSGWWLEVNQVSLCVWEREQGTCAMQLTIERCEEATKRACTIDHGTCAYARWKVVRHSVVTSGQGDGGTRKHREEGAHTLQEREAGLCVCVCVCVCANVHVAKSREKRMVRAVTESDTWQADAIAACHQPSRRSRTVGEQEQGRKGGSRR
jgi:hypothetical protein